jgi:hypothetical protein
MAPKRQNTLAARIKSLMRADEDVGKIAQASPVVIGEFSSLERLFRLISISCVNLFIVPKIRYSVIL